MLSTDFTTKLLDLKDATIEKMTVNDTQVNLWFEFKRKPHSCPCCGYVTSLVHDYRMQTVKDIPLQGKALFLHYRKRRYRCPSCEKRFAEVQSLVPKYHQLTSRFVIHLLQQLREKRSLTDITRHQPISTTTLMRLLSLVSAPTPTQLPEVLSIDEFRGNAGGKRFQCILTDPKNHRLVDILSGRESHILTDYFRQFNDRKQVKYIVMDMNRAYLDVMKTYFPQAKIIIDRFHYVRYNTWAFENVRRRVQKNLPPEKRKYFKRSRKLLLARMNDLSEKNKSAVNVMLSFSDDLTKAYLLKEKFYEFVDAKNTEEAETALKAFFLFAHVQDIKEYTPCLTMLSNWKPYILNSFDHRYSNGYTEGFNNKIKVLKRIAFGFRNFDNMRKRIFLI